jgi:hypothetical protein
LSALGSLIGKLQFAGPSAAWHPPFTRRVIDASSLRHYVAERKARGNDRRLHFAQRSAGVRTGACFQADVRFWRSHLRQWNDTERWRSARPAQFVFASGSSLAASASSAQLPSALRPGSGYVGFNPPPSPVRRAVPPLIVMTWGAVRRLRRGRDVWCRPLRLPRPVRSRAGDAEPPPRRPPARDLHVLLSSATSTFMPCIAPSRRRRHRAGRLPVSPQPPQRSHHSKSVLCRAPPSAALAPQRFHPASSLSGFSLHVEAVPPAVDSRAVAQRPAARLRPSRGPLPVLTRLSTRHRPTGRGMSGAPSTPPRSRMVPSFATAAP